MVCNIFAHIRASIRENPYPTRSECVSRIHTVNECEISANRPRIDREFAANSPRISAKQPQNSRELARISAKQPQKTGR
eukprot:5261118-Prymnesium_polylepis.1